jgi:hypothetical protein
VFAAKPSASLDDVTTLFTVSSWTKVGTLEDGTVHYVGELNLHTDEIAGAVTTEPIQITCDIEVQSAANAQRITYQFTALLNPEAYANDADPTPGTQAYPAVGAIALNEPAGGLHGRQLAGGQIADNYGTLDGFVTTPVQQLEPTRKVFGHPSAVTDPEGSDLNCPFHEAH